MFIKTKGLITREVRFKDTDKILTVITADRGVLTVKARNVLRIKSQLSAGCQLLAFTDFTLFENRGMLTVNAAEPIELFMGLRNDACRLALASYLADLSEKIAESDAGTAELMRLALNCLYALSERGSDMELVRAAFEMRAAALAGYEPQLDVCGCCGEIPEEPYLSPADGTVYCKACLPPDGNGMRPIPCPARILPLLRFFLTAPLNRLIPTVNDETLIRDAVYVTERYLLAQLDNDSKALRYYKSLCLFSYKMMTPPADAPDKQGN